MTTIELEAYKAELAREILDTDSRAILDKVKKLLTRERKKTSENLTPYTMEEINSWLDESEADTEAGREYSSEEVFKHMEEKYPWLCK